MALLHVKLQHQLGWQKQDVTLTTTVEWISKDNPACPLLNQELQLRPDPERLLHEAVRLVRERRQEEKHPCRAPLGMNIVN